MAQRLHPRARTTIAIRKEIARSSESVRELAKRFDVNPKTIVKWKRRESPADAPMGRPIGSIRSLSERDEGWINAHRLTCGGSLDDCFLHLKKKIPHLTRSSLQRCLNRLGINHCAERKRCGVTPRVMADVFEDLLRNDIDPAKMRATKKHIESQLRRLLKYVKGTWAYSRNSKSRSLISSSWPSARDSR